MSTHYIEEAERLCDSVSIVSHGVAVATGPPKELTVEHAGREAVEVYGSPTELAAVEAKAKTDGLITRRTGTSLTIVAIDRADPALVPDGERRATTLEDAFVVLTGEEIS